MDQAHLHLMATSAAYGRLCRTIEILEKAQEENKGKAKGKRQGEESRSSAPNKATKADDGTDGDAEDREVEVQLMEENRYYTQLRAELGADWDELAEQLRAESAERAEVERRRWSAPENEISAPTRKRKAAMLCDRPSFNTEAAAEAPNQVDAGESNAAAAEAPSAVHEGDQDTQVGLKYSYDIFKFGC